MKNNETGKTISGFSKLNKRGKLTWLVENFFKEPESVMRELVSFWHGNEEQQKILDAFSENTITNFPLPFSVAPNFVINGKTYCVPMVIEESSVVAAASSSAKFWMSRGGFHAEVIDDKKIGQIHLVHKGSTERLRAFFDRNKNRLVESIKPLTASMEKRGGGIVDITLKSFLEEDGYHQIVISFKTCDSMGANFINTTLESFAKNLKTVFIDEGHHPDDLDILMCILSNYTPDCLVRVEATCPVTKLAHKKAGMTGKEFGKRFQQAVRIAQIDPFRAATHNKGIFNGIDAVVLATGNDFRAVEACGHAYASRDGTYRSLSYCEIIEGEFKFGMEIPLAVGTVGGLTKLHPMAKRSLEMLGNPGAHELMMIIAAVGLAQNFAAIRSLVTTGIQKGHMKMHLSNLLHQLHATEREFKLAIEHFSHELVSHTSVRDFIENLRKLNTEIGTKATAKEKS